MSTSFFTDFISMCTPFLVLLASPLVFVNHSLMSTYFLFDLYSILYAVSRTSIVKALEVKKIYKQVINLLICSFYIRYVLGVWENLALPVSHLSLFRLPQLFSPRCALAQGDL